jgi:hypothetical protein
MAAKKAPNAPALQAAIGNAGGELQRGGAGGSMSVIAAMSVKKYVPGSAQGVLPVKGDFIEALCGGFLIRLANFAHLDNQSDSEKKQNAIRKPSARNDQMD